MGRLLYYCIIDKIEFNRVYDGMGNPTTYLGKSVTWKGRQMISFNGNTFKYNGRGRRTNKNSIAFTYDSRGNLIKQSNGLEFYYDIDGIAACKYNGTMYYYMTDAQGNVIGIVDRNGNVVVQYWYDAWGNHKVVSANGTTITSSTHIGNVNPFRYRGYYYDTETGLYFLQTRYYDPEVGRFLNRDSVQYADPQTFGGLDLYAYCLNNPVEYVDPTGEMVLSLLFSALVGLTAAAVSSIVAQKLTGGEVDWRQVGISALFGAVSSIFSFVGVGRLVGQFLIQGGLGIAEMYSLAALDGSTASIGIEEVLFTFFLSGGLGSIGSKNATKEFKKICDIEKDFLKYTIRDIGRNSTSIISTISKRGAKYFDEFIKPFFKQSLVVSGITAIANTADYWIQKLYERLF